MFACLWAHVSLKYLSLCDDPFCVCAVVYLPDKWGIGGVTLHRKDREDDGWFCIHGKESGSRKLTGSQGVPCAIGGSPVVMTLWTVGMETDLNWMPMEKHVAWFIQWNSIMCSANTCWLESFKAQHRKNKQVCQHLQLSHTKLRPRQKNPAVKLVVAVLYFLLCVLFGFFFYWLKQQQTAGSTPLVKYWSMLLHTRKSLRPFFSSTRSFCLK